MNKRIQELAKQADGVFIHKLITGAKQYTFLENDLERFAKLIVEECIEQVITGPNGPAHYAVEAALRLKKHFGVEV
jgi:hypothetical protein